MRACVQETQRSTSTINVFSNRRVLLLGSGRVAHPVVKLFGAHEDVHVTIASDDEAGARVLMQGLSDSKVAYKNFSMPRDNHKIGSLVKDADVVISLLPATMHMPVAREAINHRRNLVTASYVSPDMRSLHEEAKQAGVVLLNEVGLDPGMDHMMIMRAVDHIHKHGGVVEELVSLCGGLPDPVAADNPLRYKFSWSPKGVLNAALKSATYLNII